VATAGELQAQIKMVNDYLAGRGGLDTEWARQAYGIRASLETAFQLAKLNEAIESGATITIRPPDGRKFRG
jgi:hypothetical protein